MAAAYPLLAELRRNELEPPVWAELMFLESQAIFRTMLALKERNIPSLSVHDSLIVQRPRAAEARVVLEGLYKAATGATPKIIVKPV